MNFRSMMLGTAVSALFAGLACVAAQPTYAQTATGLPAKPLKIVVPWPPGGAADITARQLQQPLSEVLGQPVVVENKSGGGGVIGTEVLVRSPADGTTIGLITSAHIASPSLYSSLPYDALKDVKPITIVTRSPNVFSVHPSSKYKTLEDVLKAAKEAPGKLLVATSGNGTAQHFGFEQMKISTGTDIVHVPYKGAGPALNDLVAGQVEIGLLNIAGTMPHVNGGRLRAIAVTSPKRSPSLPDVPAVAELLPGFDFAEWFSMMAPAGVPDELIEKLYAAISKAARTKTFTDKMRDIGLELDLNSPLDFKKLVASEHKKLSELAKTAKIKLD